MDDTAGSPALRLARLLDGFVTTQLVYVAAKLGIPAVLEDGPRAGTEIAAAVGADAGALVRVLRGLVVDGVLAEECVAGDFFERVPAGGDTYVLSRVLHDWDDTDARRILDTCRAAMAPAARLLVIDAVLPVRALDAPGAIRMDLHMLMLFGSRERTEAELGALLGAAGFTVARVVPTSSPTGLAVTEARPAEGSARYSIVELVTWGAPWPRKKIPGKPWVSKPRLRLWFSFDCVMRNSPVRSFDTKKIAPPPSLAVLSRTMLPARSSVNRLPSR